VNYVVVRLEPFRTKLEFLSKSLERNRERESLVIEIFLLVIVRCING
jgi:hypothetical protein